MKNLATTLSVIALAGVLILSVLHFSSRPEGGTAAQASSQGAGGGVRIAYVDIDTFEANYEYLKQKREEFNKRQETMQGELERSAQQYQNNVEAFQRKIQSGNISQAEGEATQKQLLQMQQSLRLREQALTEQLLKEKDAFNQKLHDELNSFLKDYNKDRKYDFILSYSELGSQILLTNKQLDITQDVIRGMNQRSAKSSDTTKKK